MDRFIGLDAHASSCTLGVVSPSGKRVGSHVVETNARCLKSHSANPRPGHRKQRTLAVKTRAARVLWPCVLPACPIEGRPNGVRTASGRVERSVPGAQAAPREPSGEGPWVFLGKTPVNQTREEREDQLQTVLEDAREYTHTGASSGRDRDPG
mgnify:CR=1 FL=1